MSKNLLNNKALLIGLGIVALIGLTFITYNASQTKEVPPSPSPSVSMPKAAKMMPTIKDHPVSGQIIVKFKPQYTEAQINAHLQQYHASVIKTISGIDQTVVKVPAGQETTISQQLKSDPYVETVQRDYTTHAFFTPNDPLFSAQYAYNNTGQAVQGRSGTAKADIHAEAAWNTTQGNGVKVAILDTGINLNQPDLAGKVVLQKSFVSTTVEDGNGHGTHVAGIIAADTNNSVGVAGTCPGCQLLIGKVLGDNGEGTTSNAADGITWAAQNGAKVISMSLGTTDAGSASLYQQAITFATQHGAIVVAAAGNDGTTQLNYPAAVNGVISVAATTNSDAKASYSNFGNWVQIAAPGDNILSTGPTHSFQIQPFGYSTSSPYYYLSGTSMATPVVAGVAALIASTQFGTSPQAIINRLYTTADKINGTGANWVNGRVNAAAAVGQPAATPTLASAPSFITPTLFCVGGNGTPPCATLPASSPTNAPTSGDSGGSGSEPSTAPSTEISPVSGNPEVSGSPSVSPIGGGGGGTPGTVLPCPSQNQSSSLAAGSKKNTTFERGGREKRQGGKWRARRNGFIGRFIQFLLQLLLRLLQLIGINPCSGSGAPGVSPIPGQPSNTPSQGVSTVPPVSSSPSQGGPQASSSAPTSGPAPTTPVGVACITSDPNGFCPGPNQHYNDPNIYGNTGSNVYVANNIAFPIAGATETLTAFSAENWNAVATLPAGNTSVVTAPQTRIDYISNNMPVPLSNFNALYASFAETMQQVSGVAYDAGFDLWGGVQGDSNSNFKYEMMIWTDQVNRGTCGGATKLATTSFGGTHGAPVQNWTLCQNGSEMIWYLSDASGKAISEQTGTVDIKPMVQYMISHGYYPSNYAVDQLVFGNEICSTGGVPAKFTLSKFTVSGN